MNAALYKTLDLRRQRAVHRRGRRARARSRCSSSRPTVSIYFLSITFLVGIVIGGLASISGAVFGAIFIQFVPNFADQISKAAPWAIYGVFLLGFMYLMPVGVAGAIRIGWARSGAGRPAAVEADSYLRGCFGVSATAFDFERMRRVLLSFTTQMSQHVNQAFVVSATALPDSRSAHRRHGRRRNTTRRDRHRNQDRQHHAVQRPGLGLRHHRQAEAAYFKMINDQGGINGRKINFISLDDGYSPPKTVEQMPQAGRAGAGAVHLQLARHAAEYGDPAST